MPIGATVAEPVHELVPQVSLDYTKERRRSCWIFVSSAGSVSRRVLSRELFCINFPPVLPKQGIPHIFPKFKPKEEITCPKN
jgi:hypothetical protein